MSDTIAVKVEHVSKTFKLPHEKQSSLKGALINIFRRGDRSYERQQVLQDISFEVQKGEFFGIVGRNGSGKSTLLKMLAGIYTPTTGSIDIDGKVTPFIELGVGFNPELTGRENVFLNGALLGFNRAEMSAMYDDIVAFAELERFMDQKLKNYSSGMQVRLAFSIATKVSSDILIFDEVLAVGDARFQQKCLDVFRQLKAAGKTIILVSHSTGDIEKFCDRVLVIEKSKSLGVMSAREAVATYEKLNIDPNHASKEKKRWGTGEVNISKVEVTSDGRAVDDIRFGDDLSVVIHLDRKNADQELPFIAGLGLYNQDNVNVSGPNSREQSYSFKKGQKSLSVSYTLRNLECNPGRYSVTAAILDQYQERSLDHIVDAVEFTIIDSTNRYGVVTFGDAVWEVSKK